MVRETFRYLWLVQLTCHDKLPKGELLKVGNFKGFESPKKTGFHRQSS